MWQPDKFYDATEGLDSGPFCSRNVICNLQSEELEDLQIEKSSSHSVSVIVDKYSTSKHKHSHSTTADSSRR